MTAATNLTSANAPAVLDDAHIGDIRGERAGVRIAHPRNSMAVQRNPALRLAIGMRQI